MCVCMLCVCCVCISAVRLLSLYTVWYAHLREGGHENIRRFRKLEQYTRTHPHTKPPPHHHHPYFTPGFLRWHLVVSRGCGGLAAASPQPSCKHLVERALWVTRFMRATCPGAHRLVRDEGYALVCLGRQEAGEELLAAYLAAVPRAEDADKVGWVG